MHPVISFECFLRPLGRSHNRWTFRTCEYHHLRSPYTFVFAWNFIDLFFKSKFSVYEKKNDLFKIFIKFIYHHEIYCSRRIWKFRFSISFQLIWLAFKLFWFELHWRDIRRQDACLKYHVIRQVNSMIFLTKNRGNINT